MGKVQTSQGKLPLEVVTDNNLLKPKYEVVAGEPVPVLATLLSGGGLGLFGAESKTFSVPQILPFPDFAPSIVASFVAGTTATQSGTLVTVTATAHGIVGSTARNGCRIYYPGSPSIPAGWYQGFAWVDANTITFTNPVSQTVASESVNAGAAFLSTVSIGSLTLPGGSMGPNGRIKLHSMRSGDTTATTKSTRMFLGGQNIVSAFLAASNNLSLSLHIYNTGTENAQIGMSTPEGILVQSAPSTATVNTAVSQTVSISASIGAAGSYVFHAFAELEVLYKP